MVDGFRLEGKLSPSSSVTTLLCLHCEYPLVDPLQVSCGDRVCADCYSRLRGKKFICKKCKEEVTVDEDCFRDKAVEYELKRAHFPCLHLRCPWSGSALSFRGHIQKCEFKPIACPNSECDFKGTESELIIHLGTCPARPVRCKRCQDTIPLNKEHDHLAKTCPGALIKCHANCGDKRIPRKDMLNHLENHCPAQQRPCQYERFGCKFTGNFHELTVHKSGSTPYHLQLVTNALQDKRLGQMVQPDSATVERDSDTIERDSATAARDFHTKKSAVDKQLRAMQRELTLLQEQMNGQFTPIKAGLTKLESSLTDLQDSFSELALMVQTLQATSYDGEFLWKIPEVARRTKEAIMGMTISLYSAPFFTSRFGYKMCLRLYLNGDGSGKGSFLSFFLTIMRGEYDALLSWPFQQMVTLMLLDQDKKKNIVQAFRPEPSSSSFWKPKTEMNIASGCPKFAPLSVLNNPSYVRNDTIFFKVVIDKSGLD